MLVDPCAAHIFLPSSCEMSVTGESVRTRIFWPASKYCDENEICAHRSQLTVMTSATMSTEPSCSAGMRCAYVRTLYSTRFGSPKIACDTWRHHVDVEPFELAGERVAEAEQQRVGGDTGDEPPALLDLVHVGARGHVARRRHRVQGRERRHRVAAVGCRCRGRGGRRRRLARGRSVGARVVVTLARGASIATASSPATSATTVRLLIGTPAVVRRCPATPAPRPPGRRGGSASRRQQRSGRVVEVVGEIGRLGGERPGRHPFELGERLVRRAGPGGAATAWSSARRRRGSGPCRAGPRTGERRAANRSAPDRGRLPTARPTPTSTAVLKRSSYGRARATRDQGEASALLASKASMRAPASATVCRYGPSRASSALDCGQCHRAEADQSGDEHDDGRDHQRPVEHAAGLRRQIQLHRPPGRPTASDEQDEERAHRAVSRRDDGRLSTRRCSTRTRVASGGSASSLEQRRRLAEVGGADGEPLAVVGPRRLDQAGVLGEHPVDPLEHGGIVGRASPMPRPASSPQWRSRRCTPPRTSGGSSPPTRNAFVAFASAFTRLVRMVWIRTSCSALLRASSRSERKPRHARRSRAHRTRG